MRGTTGRVIGNTFWLLLQKIGGSALTLLLTIYLARQLGSQGFGALTFALSFSLLFLVLSDMGITTLTIREVARDKERGPKYVGNIASLKLFLSIFAFMIILIATFFMKVPFDTRIVIYLVGAGVIFKNFGAFWGAIFQANEKMQYVTICVISERVFILLASIILLYLGFGLICIGFLYLFSGLFYCLLSMCFVYRKFLKPLYNIDMDFWRKSFKEAVPLATVVLISMVYFHIDIVMLGKMKGEETAGWYGVSYNLFLALTTIMGAFLASIFPVMSRLFKESEELLKDAYHKAFKVMLGVGLPVSVASFLLSEKVILFLFGTQYQHSVAALKILSLFIIFGYLNGLAGYFLTSINRQAITAKLLASTTAINIVLNFILIPRYSYIGAAYATAASEVLFFIVAFLYIRKRMPSISLMVFAKAAISAAIMGFLIIISIQKGYNLFLIIAIGMFSYTFFVWITGYITKGEKARLKEAFSIKREIK